MSDPTATSGVVSFFADSANKVWAGLLLGVGLVLANYLMEKFFHIGFK